MTREISQAVGLTESIIDLVTDRSVKLTESMMSTAEKAIIDLFAVTIAAIDDPAVRVVSETADLQALSGPSSVLTCGRRSPPSVAALIGGVAGHALDFDDVDDAIMAHPSTVLLPALLAIGEALDVNGHELISAYWVGLRACRRIAAVLGVEHHYNLGWHSTATIGAIGAAAGVARLLRLDGPTTRNALGIAGSLASGSRQNFGTMVKPLHAGTAAESGVRAAQLAGFGMDAAADQMDGPLGFLRLHGGTALTGYEQDQRIEDISEQECAPLNVKLYPCCYYTHAAADAALALAKCVDVSTISSIEVLVRPGGMSPLIHPRPTTGAAGKFSIEYVVAAALLDGAIDFESFTDAAVTRPAAQRLLQLVRPREDATSFRSQEFKLAPSAAVTVQTTDGQSFGRQVDLPDGHAYQPPSDQQLLHKLSMCLHQAGQDAGAPVFEILRNFRTVTSVRDAVRDVAALLEI